MNKIEDNNEINSKQKPHEINKFYDIFVDNINDLDIKLKQQLKKIKTEYKNNLKIEKENLLKEICINENLDFEIMKSKYLIEKINNKKSIVNDTNIILNKIIIDSIEYYYNNKEDNTFVYNNKFIKIGFYKNNEIVFD